MKNRQSTPWKNNIPSKIKGSNQQSQNQRDSETLVLANPKKKQISQSSQQLQQLSQQRKQQLQSQSNASKPPRREQQRAGSQANSKSRERSQSQNRNKQKSKGASQKPQVTEQDKNSSQNQLQQQFTHQEQDHQAQIVKEEYPNLPENTSLSNGQQSQSNEHSQDNNNQQNNSENVKLQYLYQQSPMHQLEIIKEEDSYQQNIQSRGVTGESHAQFKQEYDNPSQEQQNNTYQLQNQVDLVKNEIQNDEAGQYSSGQQQVNQYGFQYISDQQQLQQQFNKQHLQIQQFLSQQRTNQDQINNNLANSQFNIVNQQQSESNQNQYQNHQDIKHEQEINNQSQYENPVQSIHHSPLYSQNIQQSSLLGCTNQINNLQLQSYQQHDYSANLLQSQQGQIKAEQEAVQSFNEVENQLQQPKSGVKQNELNIFRQDQSAKSYDPSNSQFAIQNQQQQLSQQRISQDNRNNETKVNQYSQTNPSNQITNQINSQIQNQNEQQKQLSSKFQFSNNQWIIQNQIEQDAFQPEAVNSQHGRSSNLNQFKQQNQEQIQPIQSQNIFQQQRGNNQLQDKQLNFQLELGQIIPFKLIDLKLKKLTIRNSEF